MTVAVIGGGHAGVAASHFLTAESIDHVVVERGELANSWRTERWDSLRLLTPNWLTTLPGADYRGDDPDGYLPATGVAELIAGYAADQQVPIRTQTTVTRLARDADGYTVSTDQGRIAAAAVIIASGACNRPTVPGLAAAVPAAIEQLTPFTYRNPQALPDGGVLIVGASATGAQLADEIQRSGRPVTLAVGEHVRMPRHYRGVDVLWWMEASGVWDQRHDEIDDLNRARRLPSPQLTGSPNGALDLNSLSALGVEVVGRFATVRDGKALFSGGLRNVLALADLKQQRLLDGFDEWARAAAPERLAIPDERPAATVVPTSPRWQIDLNSGEFATVIWATGFRPDYSWLDIPVLDDKGHLRHEGGVVTDSPGLYALGLPVLRRRKSTFIHGIEDDAREVVGELSGILATR